MKQQNTNKNNNVGGNASSVLTRCCRSDKVPTMTKSIYRSTWHAAQCRLFPDFGDHVDMPVQLLAEGVIEGPNSPRVWEQWWWAVEEMTRRELGMPSRMVGR